MSKKIIHEYLKYQFTREELEGIADEMAKAAGEMDEAESRKKAVTAQIKAEIEQATAEHQKFYRLYRDKFEYRNIECEKALDHIKGTVTVTRLDTGEIVKVRPMTADERQQELKLNPLEPEIDRDPEVDTDNDPDTDSNTGTPQDDSDAENPSDSIADTDTDTDTDEEVMDEDDDPTPEEIERGVVEHGARLGE